MIKNRDTASNPYRVPRQPTAKWIKISIIGLFFSNVALIGGVVFLVFSAEKCSRMCQGSGLPDKWSPKHSKESMAKDQAIVLSQGSLQKVTERVNTVEENLVEIKTVVTGIKESCKKSTISSVAKQPRTSTTGYDFPHPSNISRKLANMQIEIAKLREELTGHISAQLCKEGHYRYGVYCFYVGDAKLTQANAKRFCATDYEKKGTLAIIKNKFVQKFLSDILANFPHSYWIGIERGQKSSWESQAIRSSKLEGDGVFVPAPQSAPESSPNDNPFAYVDGTRVQSKVWEMWSPQATRHSGRNNCVALTYDGLTSTWYWQDHDCSSKLGYICQYYSMGIGY